MRPGLALFVGQSGDNRMHRHLAHQLCVALRGSATVELPGGMRTSAPGLCLPAGQWHRLMPGSGVQLWLDPTTALARHLLAGKSPEVTALPARQVRALRALALGDAPAALAQWVAEQGGATPAPDPRLSQVLAHVQQALAEGGRSVRDELALQAGLSPGRFSHWFAAQTGMPLRSYQKWLRLLAAVERVLGGEALAQAAVGAGFSDQAHFSRTLMQWLGVPASLALRQVVI